MLSRRVSPEIAIAAILGIFGERSGIAIRARPPTNGNHTRRDR
jgi:hypothetical protein